MFEIGYSQVDWVRLTQTHPDLAGLKGQPRRRDITLEEVAQHASEGDAWTVRGWQRQGWRAALGGEGEGGGHRVAGPESGVLRSSGALPPAPARSMRRMHQHAQCCVRGGGLHAVPAGHLPRPPCPLHQSPSSHPRQVLRGRVYNITPYLRFHPGGVPLLMKAAGRDGTALFNKYHAWWAAGQLLLGGVARMGLCRMPGAAGRWVGAARVVHASADKQARSGLTCHPLLLPFLLQGQRG